MISSVHPLVRRLALFAACGAGVDVAGCGARDRAGGGRPPAAHVHPRQLWQLARGPQGLAGGRRRSCLFAVRLAARRDRGGPRTLLAMCGETEAAVQNGMPGMDTDATTGTIDLYVLKPAADGKTLEPVMKKTEIASGGRGEPGTVRIERLGPHLFGFVIGESDTRQAIRNASARSGCRSAMHWCWRRRASTRPSTTRESTECANARRAARNAASRSRRT